MLLIQSGLRNWTEIVADLYLRSPEFSADKCRVSLGIQQ